MAGSLSFFWKKVVLRNGVWEEPRGFWNAAQKVVALSGKPAVRKRVVIPKLVTSGTQPRPTLIWTWEEQPTPVSLTVHIDGPEGLVILEKYCDKPTSTTDIAPTGTHINAGFHQYLSCLSPFELNSVAAKVHSTPATAVGLDGNGEPAIDSSGSWVDGRFYKLWARNTSNASDVTVVVDIES